MRTKINLLNIILIALFTISIGLISASIILMKLGEITQVSAIIFFFISLACLWVFQILQSIAGKMIRKYNADLRNEELETEVTRQPFKYYDNKL